MIVDPGKELQLKMSGRNKKLKSYSDKYEDLKHSEGEILAYYLKLRKEHGNKLDGNRLDQLVAAVRNAINSAKAMKDVQHNRKEFRDSANDAKYANYLFFQDYVEAFYKELNDV